MYLFFCHPMPSPYIMADSNHISLQLLAKFSEPDFLALCLCDSSRFSWTPSSAFFSACSSLSVSPFNNAMHNNLKELSHQCAALFQSLSSLLSSAMSSQYFFSIFLSPAFLLSYACASSCPFSFPLVLLLFFIDAFLIEGQNKWEKCQVLLSKPVDWTCWRISDLQGIGFIGLLAWMEMSGSACRLSEHNFSLHGSTAALPLSKCTLKGLAFVSVCEEYG